LSWRASLLVLPLAFFIYVPLELLIKRIKGSQAERVSASVGLNAWVTDLFSNIILVKSYANEKNEQPVLLKISDSIRRHTFNLVNKQDVVPLLVDAASATVFVFIAFIFIFVNMHYDQFSLARFLVYFFVLRRFLMASKSISSLKTQTVLIAPLLDKIAWIFDNKGKAYMPHGKINFQGLKSIIEYKNVNFGYTENKNVISGVNMLIKKGETVALVGPTGSGKTTLAHLLMRFYDCGYGGIFIDGVNMIV
jgi:ABC-type multidrug transport system fused ATPase/permease subunit